MPKKLTGFSFSVQAPRPINSNRLFIKHSLFFFKFGKVTVAHDIEAAAIACCKNDPGIISICGSGSNAAWYDGKKIKPNNYGLGYILADEGSGNWLGRQLIKGFMNETLPDNTRKKFVARYDTDRKPCWRKFTGNNSRLYF